MRILFYVEPLTERDSPTWKTAWIGFVDKMVNSLRKDAHDFEFMCVVGDGLEGEARRVLGDAAVTYINHVELIPRLGGSALDLAMNWYRGHAPKALNEMGALLKSRLGEFAPDVCITFSPAPFVKTAFPRIPTLYFELGLFSRLPFPMTGYLDPLGMFNNSYFFNNKGRIRKFVADEEEQELVNIVREIYLSKISQSNPLKETIKTQLKDFKSAILVALQFSQFYGYDAHAKYVDQYDMLLHVLEKVPPDFAVIAVEHPQYHILYQDAISHLTERYNNFIWVPQLRSLPSASQYLMEFVDCVVTVSSSVGLQSLLWKKRLIVLGNSHLDVVADSHDLGNIHNIIAKTWPVYKENVLAWHLSRYTIPFGLLFDKGVLASRIQTAINSLEAQDENYDKYFLRPYTNVQRVISFYEKEDLVTRHDDEIQKIRSELACLRSDEQNEAIAKQHVLESNLTQADTKARADAEIIAKLQNEVENKQALLQQAQTHAETITQHYKVQESVLREQMSLIVNENHRILELKLTQAEINKRLEMEAILRTQIEREHAFTETITQLHEKMEAQRVEQQQAASTAVQILTRKQDEREASLLRQMELKEHDIHLLKENSKAERRVYESELNAIFHTHSWRWTAPFRQVCKWFVSPNMNSSNAKTNEIIMNNMQQAIIPNVKAASTLNDLLSHRGAAFVQCAYLSLLGRAPEAEGLRYYLTRMCNGVSKMEILGQIRTGKEGRNKRVAIQDLDAAILRLSRPMNRFKRTIKRRLNLNTETCSNVQDVISTLSPLTEQQAIIPNVKAASTLNDLLSHRGAAFVQCAYLSLLGRAPEAEGLRYYLTRMCNGVSKMEILGQIRTGKEGRNKRVAIQDLDAAILRLSRPMNRFKRMIKRRLNLNTETCSNVHDVITDLIALKAGQNTINTSEEIPVEVANRNYSNIIPLTGEQILLATAKNVPTDAAKPEDNLYSPLISIVLPTYNSSEVYLKGAIESVLSQSYGKLQLCIIDDGSPDKSCRVHIQNFADKDHRIKVKYLSKNVGIGAASQVGAEMADGEFIGFVDHDDILAPSALSHFVNKLREDPGIDMLYSDHAMINEEGRLTSAALKPGFAPEFLLSTNYIVHFKLVRKSIFNTVGGFEGTFYASQDYGLTLKLLDAGARIVHVPGLLYFWRLHPGSVASGSSAKPGVLHACIKTVDSYLQKNNIPAKTICPDEFKNMDVGIYKLEFQQPLPSVSIVIPVKQESPELIALLVDIENDQGISLTNVHVVGLGVNLKIKQRGLNTLRSDSQEEFDRLMLSIHSDVIVFISPESKLIDSDWLREIVGYFNVSNEIGAVGGKIVDPNDKVIGGGVLFLSGLPTIGAGLYASDTCYWSYGKLVTNVEAVSSDFMAVRKKHYKVAGGFKVYGNELPIGVCIGICLRKAGLRVVYNPWAKIASTKIIRHRKLRALDELELTRYPDRYYNKYFDAKYPYRIKHTQPLRINFALPPSPKISGGPLAILEYANRLAARGHTVTITTYPDSHWEGENPFPWFKFSGKILFKQDRNSDSTFQRGQLLANFSSMPHKTPFEFMFIEGSIWSGLIEAMPDCDINIATYWSTAFPVYFSHKGKPVYFMQHYEEIFYTMQHDYMMHKQMARTSYALPIYKIANSSWLQKLIKEKYEQLIPFSNNGIELSDFTPMPKLSSSDHVIRVVTYSRPEDWKGFSDAVGAMQKVIDKFGDKVQWHVFGYKHETISESNKYATYHYHPRLSFIQLAELYATSDISLCPSWYESFPLPPLESMASGTAVVTTKYGTEDYAFDDYNALVVESRDIDKMADAIVRLIQDKNLRNRLAVEGRRTAELFNWDRAVEERERLIYQIHYGEIDYDVLHSARSGLYDANGVCFESANFKNLPDRGLFTQDGMVFLLYQGSKHHITEGYLTRKIENIGTSWITLTPLDAMRIPWGAALTNESDIPAFPLPEKGLFVDDGKVYLLYQGAKHHVTEEYITKMIDDAGVKWITLSPQEMARVPREAALMSESDIPWDYS